MAGSGGLGNVPASVCFWALRVPSLHRSASKGWSEEEEEHSEGIYAQL